MDIFGILFLAYLSCQKRGEEPVFPVEVANTYMPAKFGMPPLKLKFLERGEDHQVT